MTTLDLTSRISSKVLPIEVANFNMFRNAKVEVSVKDFAPRAGAKPVPHTHIIVNDKYENTFSETSRLTRALQHMTPQAIQDRLTGGSFFFLNGQLVDFKDGQSETFIHSNETIAKMIDLIGVRAVSNRDRKALGMLTVAPNFVLSGYYDQREIVIPEYLDGGVFNTRLMYNWNPFHKNVKGVFELIRLICTNGMVGVSDFLNTQFPAVNRWEENLEIAARQIQNKVTDKTQMRLKQMSGESATVGELQLLTNHAVARLMDTGRKEPLPADVRERLTNMYKIVNPVPHMAKYYNSGAFTDSNVAAQLPAHLSTFDAFNIATEMYTHTNEVTNSSGFALQKFANGIMFDGKKKREQLLSRVSQIAIGSAFANAEVAFASEMVSLKK